MSASTQHKCGFCEQVGHKIGACNDPYANLVIEMFHEGVNRTVPGGNADPVFNWLKSRTAKEIKLLANRHNIAVSKSKKVIVSTIMDYHFYNHPNPTWRESMPTHEELIQRYRATILRRQICFMASGLNMPIVINIRQLARLRIAELDNLYNVIEQEFRAQQNNGNGLHHYHYANHPQNVQRKFNVVATVATIPKNADQYAVQECPICLENVTIHNIVELNCKHEFCGDCLSEQLKTTSGRREPCCALCRTDMVTFKTQSQEIYDNIRPTLV